MKNTRTAQGVRARLFSVMHKRDDLPQMTAPLVILLIILISAFAAAASKLAGADYSSPIYSALGVASSTAFYPIIVCFYSLIILLWRKVASLLATPIMFAVTLAASGSLFWTAAITLSVLFVSYMFAVSMISRESRFRRTAALALSYAVCISLACIAAVGLCLGTFESFTDAFMEKLPALLEKVCSELGYTAVHEIYYKELARSIIVKVPAIIGVISVVMAFVTDYLTSLAFRILGCENVFIEITKKITMPLSYAVIYTTVFFMTIFTSYEYNPLIYEMLSGVMLVMMLPCAVIGFSGFVRDMEERLYYVSREKILTVIIIVIAAAVIGISGCITVASIMGAYFVIKEKVSLRFKTDQNE